MRKLTLDVDSLAVQSFPTEAPEAGGRGTVHGHSLDLCSPTGGHPACPSMAAATDCPQSYYGTCVSCGNTCADCTYTCPTNGQECWEDS